jgi:hypothetical protein
MKNFIKKIIIAAVLAYALYGAFIWTRYKEQEEIYYSEIQLNLAPICKEIMQETYRQYLGPVGFEKNEDKGSVRLVATVYFPNMAPQNISCSIYLDNYWIGYDENSTVNIHFLGTDYAPNGFYRSGQSPTHFTKITFKRLQSYPVSPRKKPTFDSTLNEAHL